MVSRQPQSSSNRGGIPSDPIFWAADRLKEAEKLRIEKKLPPARRICEDLVERFPDYVGALQTLGLILADMGKHEDAIGYLSRAAVYCPRDWRILTALSNINLAVGRAETARAVLEQAQALEPDEPIILGTLGQIYQNQKEYELAAETYEKFLAVDDTIPEIRLPLTDCYEHLGQLEKAARQYEMLVKEGQVGLSTISGIAQLPEGFSSIDALALLDQVTEDQESTNYQFALGMALNRAGRHDEAWEHIDAANKLKWREMEKEWRDSSDYRRKTIEFASSLPGMSSAPPVPHGHAISLFILGPSRSGKTTLERALSALPGVKCGYENPIVENAVRRTLQVSGCITRSAINGMPPALDPVFQEHYLAELKSRAGDARVFTNTHPAKLNEVMRYARSLPGARVIFVNRDREDIAIRTYMKSYATGNAYSYNLNAITEHTDWYYRLAGICAEKLPEMTMQVNYEDLIADTLGVLNKVAAFCGLDELASAPPALGDDRGAARPYAQKMRAVAA